MKTTIHVTKRLLIVFGAVIGLIAGDNCLGQQIIVPRTTDTNMIAVQITIPPSSTELPIMAILVNSTNFESATWIPFNPTPLIDLGAGDGPRDVWFGFQFPSGAEFHIYRKVILDTAPPTAYLTSPLGDVVTTPYLQVNGYFTKPMQSVSYDLVNTNGTFADQEAFITRREINPDTRTIGTNYFQCYDVPLANGLNTITVKGIDVKSNAWFSTFTVTLDISQLTNPPAISLIWPKDGTSIGSDSVTLRGTVADGNMQVSAVVTDEAGNSENIEGLVERDGTFWLDDVNLTGATNSVLITVTDPAGNMTTTNIALFRAPVTVGMTDPSDYELLQPTISLTGTIDSSEYDVWVNGQQAMDNGDGTWSATNVPVSQGGTATFHTVAVPKSANATAPAPGSAIPAAVSHASVFSLSPASPGAVHAASTLDVPAKLSVASYSMGLTFDHDSWWGDMLDIQEYVISWSDFSGGQSQLSMSAFNPKPWINPPLGPRTSVFTQSNWGPTGPGTATTIGSLDGVPGIPTVGSAPRPTIAPYAPVYPWEQACRWKDVSESIPGLYYWPGTEAKDVTTIISLATGGRSGVNRVNLFTLTGAAWDTENTWIPTATPLYPFPYQGLFQLSPSSLKILGKNLGSDGRLYRKLPDNATVDVTLSAPGFNNYAFDITATKHRVFIVANGVPLLPDRAIGRAKFCVGQKMNFSYSIIPDPDGEDYSLRTQQWFLSPKFINKVVDNYGAAVTAASASPFAVNVPQMSSDYVIDPTLFQNATTPAWYVSGGFPFDVKNAKATVNLTFQNGQSVSITGKGKFKMHRPKVTRVGSFEGGVPEVHADEGKLALGKTDGSGEMNFESEGISLFPGKVGYTQIMGGTATLTYGVPSPIITVPFSVAPWEADNAEFYQNAVLSTYPMGSFAPIPGYSGLVFGFRKDLTDGPSIGLDNIVGLIVGFYSVAASVNYQFQDYLRFRPNAGSESENIFVTLQRVEWSVEMACQWTAGGGWSITLEKCPRPIDFPEDAFPMWNDITSNFGVPSN